MSSTQVNNAIKAFAWGLAASVAIAATPATAGGFAAPDIQVLYGADQGDFFGSGIEGGKLFPMFTIELANGWSYGDNFFFSDINQGPQYDTTKAISSYSEIHSRLSAGKISGKDMSFGPVSDVLLAGEIDLPSSFTPTYCYGLGFDLKIPGFAFAFVNVFLRDEVSTKGVSFQINPVWMLPLSAGPVKGVFGGWVDVMSGEGPDQDWWWQAQPTLLLDVANFWGSPNKLLMGCEYEYFHNFLGIGQGDVNHPQFVVQWNL
ncbi:MAG: putative outer rane channel-forming protein [Fibrobacteres bacterium]|nr:putative outer rane channel-forming protein [Fibrobacterota bacterium]